MVDMSSCTTDFFCLRSPRPAPFPLLVRFPVRTACCVSVVSAQCRVPGAGGHYPRFLPAYAEEPEVPGLPATASCSRSPSWRSSAFYLLTPVWKKCVLIQQNHLPFCLALFCQFRLNAATVLNVVSYADSSVVASSKHGRALAW